MFFHFFIKSRGVKGWQAIDSQFAESMDTFTWTAQAEEMMRRYFNKNWRSETRVSRVRVDVFDTNGKRKCSIRQVADFI